MSRYRNLSTVSLLGEAITGVQSVQVRLASTRITHEGDNDAGVQDIGVTKRFVSITVEAEDSSKRRDIRSPQFTDALAAATALNEVLSVEASVEGQPVQDSAEDDTWLTYIGVRSVEAGLDLGIRDVNQALGTTFPIGIRGTVDFDLQAPLSTHGLPDSAATTNFSMANLVLESVDPDVPHGELAEARMHFGGHGTGGAAPLITCAAIPKAVAATGTFSFVAISATGGTNKTVTISNCVLVRLRARAGHGEIFRVTYEIQAYSIDGVTSPIAVT